ncbi:hypothetical protein M0804_014952 [Polistes exclamans]|nr:hypothetical protein M0804_014952 [Polistes exclamans]
MSDVRRENASGFIGKSDAMPDQSPKSPMISRLPIHTIGVINVVAERELEERRSSYKYLSAPLVSTKTKKIPCRACLTLQQDRTRPGARPTHSLRRIRNTTDGIKNGADATNECSSDKGESYSMRRVGLRKKKANTAIANLCKESLVSELKEKWAAFELATTGVKSELIARLMEADPSGNWVTEDSIAKIDIEETWNKTVA